QDSLSVANRPSIHMTKRCTYYLNSRTRISPQGSLLVALTAAQGMFLSPLAQAISSATPDMLINYNSGLVGWYANTNGYSSARTLLEVTSSGTLHNNLTLYGTFTSTDGYVLHNMGTMAGFTNDDLLSASSADSALSAVIFNDGGIMGTITNNASMIGTNAYGIQNSGSLSMLNNVSDGVISGIAGVYNTGNITAITNDGTISGSSAGLINSAGGTIGTLTNNGTLSGSSYAIASDSLSSIGTIINSGTIAGNIASGTPLTIAGSNSGVGTLTGSNGQVGNILLDNTDLSFSGGNLYLNDHIQTQGGSVTNSAATLLVDNALNIDGSYIQSSAAALVLGVSDSAVANGNATTDSGYGRLIVSGSAIVDAGSTIALLRSGNSYNFASGQRYVVIDAASTGTDYHSSHLNYQAIGYTDSVTGSTVTSDGRSALVVSLGSWNAPGDNGSTTPITPVKHTRWATSGNAISSLNGLASHSGIGSGILDLYNASLAIDNQAEANRVGERLSSTQNINASAATAAASDAAFAVVGNHINAQRNPDSSDISGVATGEGDEGWMIWGQPFGGFAQRGTSSEVSGYRAKFGGLLLGADRALGDSWRSGAALTYSITSVHGEDNLAGNRSTASNYGVIGYAGYTGEPWFVNLSAGLAHQNYSTLRQVSFTGYQDSANGNFNGNSVTLQTEAGYPLALARDTVLTPLASLAWSYQHLDGYQESSSNGMGLTVDAAHAQSLTSDIGARLEHAIATGFGNLTPYLQLSWIHQYDNRQMSSSASYSADTLGETRFTTKGAAPVKDMAGVALGSTLYQAGDTSLDARYDLQRGENYQAHTFSLRLSKQF
ncbi:autotransporter domain-containing protein, partial [Erwinia sp. V71]|uniref:autotransporter family protein n=1 Tax=Erwinia sp. V71 TaxID=3369424 RepID=UPI003F5E2362